MWLRNCDHSFAAGSRRTAAGGRIGRGEMTWKTPSRAALERLLSLEAEAFRSRRPRSGELFAESRAAWRGGVPFHWMSDWATPWPIFAVGGKDARITDVDGLHYDDFCLADTPAMFGHGLPGFSAAIARRLAHGAGFMTPTPDAPVVGRLLVERFGLDQWQMATTATEANRAAIRWSRAVTGRPKVLVFDGGYHGAVDDTFLSLDGGEPAPKAGLIGQVQDLRDVACVVPFNDLVALEARLACGDVACVLAEPVMTNCGMILPDPGFHRELRRLTRAAGSLLVLDETHTLSSGPGGYVREHGLDPDIWTCGKAIAGGLPAAVWGVTDAVAKAMDGARARVGQGYSGIGTTLSGNALALAAIRHMLEEVMTASAYDAMLAGADRLVAGLGRVIAQHGAPWSVVRAGARVELVFADPPARNAAAMRPALDPLLLDAYHLWLLNRGVLIAPFHNMMLVSPVTRDEQIDRLVALTGEFSAALETLCS